jgi:hypothetical protein
MAARIELTMANSARREQHHDQDRTHDAQGVADGQERLDRLGAVLDVGDARQLLEAEAHQRRLRGVEKPQLERVGERVVDQLRRGREARDVGHQSRQGAVAPDVLGARHLGPAPHGLEQARRRRRPGARKTVTSSSLWRAASTWLRLRLRRLKPARMVSDSVMVVMVATLATQFPRIARIACCSA